jgi:hypothetical protein
MLIIKPKPQFVHPAYRRSHGKRKLGFDLHGVIDAKSDSFRILFRDLIRQGWEIHILTGATWTKERKTLKRLKIPFTHFFSIIDYHSEIGTPIVWDKKGNPHMDDYLWSRTKGEYCKIHKITMHFDDSDTYGFFFQTPYVRFFSKDTTRVQKMHITAKLKG